MTSLEVNGSCSDYRGELHFRGSPSDHEYPLFTSLNGTLMARPRSVHIWSLPGAAAAVAMVACELPGKPVPAGVTAFLEGE
jgi:hypothetical protein